MTRMSSGKVDSLSLNHEDISWICSRLSGAAAALGFTLRVRSKFPIAVKKILTS